MGDPNEPTDPFIRQALVDGAAGAGAATRSRRACPSCARRSPAGCERRFGVAARPGHRDHPDLGSKEAIFPSRRCLDPRAGKDVVVVRRARYPVYERGALFAGARVRDAAAAARANGFLPDLERPRDDWDGSRSSGSTTRTTRPARSPRSSFYERLAALGGAARLRARLGRGVHRALVRRAAGLGPAGCRPRRNVVVFHTLSKRSSMTGYRSGFVAAPPRWSRR